MYKSLVRTSHLVQSVSSNTTSRSVLFST